MLVVGATASLAFMLHFGSRSGFILIGLFAGWVLSPFAVLAVADTRAKRWSVVTRTTLYVLMLILALGSIAIYGVNASTALSAKPAAVFLLVPLGSWFLLVITASITALVKRIQ